MRRVNVNPVDWVAERAWLLLRLGEADAARMLVAGVDADRFTPKMIQVAVQSALANADPPALCPLEDGIRKYDRGHPAAGPGDVRLAGRRAGSRRGDDRPGAPLTAASAGSTWRWPRRWSAPAPTAALSTIEWDPVDNLTAWRFGLATGDRGGRRPTG